MFSLRKKGASAGLVSCGSGRRLWFGWRRLCWEEGKGNRGLRVEAGFGCEANRRKRGSCGRVCVGLGGETRGRRGGGGFGWRKGSGQHNG